MLYCLERGQFHEVLIKKSLAFNPDKYVVLAVNHGSHTGVTAMKEVIERKIPTGCSLQL